MKIQKSCSICSIVAKSLFRCRYNHKKEWGFLCQKCLTVIKSSYLDSYQYGGTKKNK